MRTQQDWTAAEWAIYLAQQEVEEAGCSVLLTDASTNLSKARDLVAQYAEENKLPPRKGGGFSPQAQVSSEDYQNLEDVAIYLSGFYEGRGDLLPLGRIHIESLFNVLRVL